MHSAFSRCTEESCQAAPQGDVPEQVYIPLESEKMKHKQQRRGERLEMLLSTVMSYYIISVVPR